MPPPHGGVVVLGDARDRLVVLVPTNVHVGLKLHEALDLVALATEKVVSKTVSDGVDASLIKASLKEAGER